MLRTLSFARAQLLGRAESLGLLQALGLAGGVSGGRRGELWHRLAATTVEPARMCELTHTALLARELWLEDGGCSRHGWTGLGVWPS